MKILRAILLLPALLVTAPAAEIVVLRSEVAMRIPNHKIEIRIEDTGKMSVRTQDIRSTWVSHEKTLEPAIIAALGEKLSAIDWNRVTRDKTTGLDGTTVEIDFRGKKAALWSPGHDSQKRGLSEIQQSIERIYQLAGLTREGLAPQAP